MESDCDAPAPGWDAIDAALRPLHGDVQPVHMAVGHGVAFGAPLEGISAFPAREHWHFVTYGLTELYAKESDDPEFSGLGYELTMRVARHADVEPPRWAFVLLAKVAHAARTVTSFDVGHRLSVGGPITGQPDCILHAVAFVADPSLPHLIKTVNGSFRFIQLVGITDDELAEMRATTTDVVIARLARARPMLVTDPRAA